MGLVSDSFSGTLEGHTITVEARTGPIAGRFALKVDGEVQDAIKAVNGEYWLDGQLGNARSRDQNVRPCVARFMWQTSGRVEQPTAYAASSRSIPSTVLMCLTGGSRDERRTVRVGGCRWPSQLGQCD